MRHPKVTILIPTYGNHEILEQCLTSICKQEYKNLTVVVLDNGASTPTEKCDEVVKKVGDSRILYKANISNLGSQVNFKKALSMARSSDYFCIIPADVKFADEAIAKMVKNMLGNSETSICYGRTVTRHVDEEDAAIRREKMLSWPHSRSGLLQASELIMLFYSLHNIKSEWSHFSFVGALVESSLLDATGELTCPYYDHGGEILISLALLVHAKKAYIMDDVTLVHAIGVKRHDTAIRPINGYTRIEPVHAEDYFLDKYEMLLQRKGISILELRIGLLRKAVYTQFRFGLVNSVLTRIAAKNCLHVMAELVLLPFDKITRILYSLAKVR